MNTEKIKHNGHIIISDIIDNQLIKKRYIGYSIIECKKMFKAYINDKEYKLNK
jgi:hypothetical protein